MAELARLWLSVLYVHFFEHIYHDSQDNNTDAPKPPTVRFEMEGSLAGAW